MLFGLVGVILVAFSAGLAHAAEPVLDVQLEVRDGFVAVDPARTTLHLDRVGAGRATFEQCGLTPERVQAELIQYLDQVLRKPGRVLEQRVAPGAQADLRALIERDPATAAMAHLTAPWPDADQRVLAWVEAHKSERQLVPNTGGGLSTSTRTSSETATTAWPTVPSSCLVEDLDDDDEIVPLARTGRLPFALAAPITGEYHATPTKNVKEWEALRKNLARDVLDALGCQLWYRDAVVDRLADYLEMRGIAVKSYRADADPPEPEPVAQVGLSPEKPHFDGQRVAGARVKISPDPLIAGALLRTQPDDTETIAKALYLLLPSDDFAKVVAQPSVYLCTMQAPWKEEVNGTLVTGLLVSLRLRQPPGSDLRLAREYVTRRFLAERMRSLDAGGFTVTPAYPEEENPPRQAVHPGEERPKPLKWTHLLISPTGNVSATTVLARAADATLPDCNTPVDAKNLGQAAPLRYDRGKDTCARPRPSRTSRADATRALAAPATSRSIPTSSASASSTRPGDPPGSSAATRAWGSRATTRCRARSAIRTRCPAICSTAAISSRSGRWADACSCPCAASPSSRRTDAWRAAATATSVARAARRAARSICGGISTATGGSWRSVPAGARARSSTTVTRSTATTSPFWTSGCTTSRTGTARQRPDGWRWIRWSRWATRTRSTPSRPSTRATTSSSARSSSGRRGPPA